MSVGDVELGTNGVAIKPEGFGGVAYGLECSVGNPEMGGQDCFTVTGTYVKPRKVTIPPLVGVRLRAMKITLRSPFWKMGGSDGVAH